MNDTSAATEPSGSADSSDPGQDESRREFGARRLTRRSEHRMVAGVASGLADYLAIDPVLVRLGFAILVFFGGAGLVLYLIGWALIPPRSGGQPMAQQALDSLADGPSWLGAVLLLGAVWIVAIQIDLWSPAVTWALVLIGVGLYLFRRDQGRAGSRAPGDGDLPPPSEGGDRSGPATTAPALAGPESPSSEWPAGAGPPPPGLPAQPPGPPGGPDAFTTGSWSAAPREHAPRSILGRLTIAVTLVALGVASVLDNLGLAFMTPSRYVALALAGVGAGLVIGTWRGRSRGLIALGALLALLLAPANLAEHIPLRGGVGELYWHAATLSEVADEYHLGAGRATLDLSQLARQPGDATVKVTMGAGRLLVWAPRGWDVDTTATVDAGEIWVLGTRDSGTGIKRQVFFAGDGSGGQLILDVEMGLGSVTVSEAYYEPAQTELESH